MSEVGLINATQTANIPRFTHNSALTAPLPCALEALADIEQPTEGTIRNKITPINESTISYNYIEAVFAIIMWFNSQCTQSAKDEKARSNSHKDKFGVGGGIKTTAIGREADIAFGFAVLGIIAQGATLLIPNENLQKVAQSAANQGIQGIQGVAVAGPRKAQEQGGNTASLALSEFQGQQGNNSKGQLMGGAEQVLGAVHQTMRDTARFPG